MARRPIEVNPYTNRAAISEQCEFYGREDTLRDVYTRIRGGQSVSLIGERRVGKSSILNAIGFLRDDFGIDDLDFVFMDMQSIAGCPEDAFLRRLLDLISRETKIEPGEPTRESMERIATELRSRNRGLIVAIDEFDVLFQSNRISAEFLVFLRSWTVRHKFPMVVAFRDGSLDRIVENEKAGSPFLNVFGTLYIGPMLEEEAKELIRHPASVYSVFFDEEDVAAILELAGFLPLYIQIACYHLFELRRDGKNLADSRRMLNSRFATDAAPHFAYMWGQLPETEQEALRSWIAEGCAKNETAEKALLRKGILVEEQGAIRVFSSVLEHFPPAWDGAPKSFLEAVKDKVITTRS